MAKEQNFEHPPGGHVAILVYDPTNDRFQVVQGDDVDTAIPAAGKSLLASALAHGYDGSAWRKQGLIWAIDDRLAEVKLNLSAIAGTNDLVFTAVPAGYVYVVNAISGVDNNSAPSAVTFYATKAGVEMVLRAEYSPTAGQWVTWAGNLPLVEGDGILARFASCTLNDDLYAVIWGSKMRIAM